MSFNWFSLGINRGGVAEQVWLPLAGIAANEAIEVFKVHTARPLVKRADLARCPVGRVVIFAKPRRAIAVFSKYSPDCRAVFGDDAVVAGEAGGLLRDHAEADRMVVAPGNERRARRRAKRCG